MGLDIFTPALGDVVIVPTWPHAGAPTSGTSGTLAGIAQPGDLMVDTTNHTLYQNTNTSASPTWTQLTAVGGSGAYSGTFDGIVGGTTPAAATVTTLTATSSVALSPADHNVVASPTGTGTVTVAPATAGTMNNVAIGTVTPAAGSFTTLAASGLRSASVGNALTAVGTDRGTALALTAEINRVTTAGASTGVNLAALTVGQWQDVYNDGANAIKVYAPGSITIDGTAGSTGVTLTNTKRCRYTCMAANVVISAQLGAVSA